MTGRTFLSDRVQLLGVSPIREIFEIAAKMKDVVRLEVGEPDFDTPAYIVDACKTALDDGFTHYTSFGGIPELRKALADKLQKENGVQVDPENQVVVTPGGRARCTKVSRRPSIPATRSCCLLPGGRNIHPSLIWRGASRCITR